MQAPRSFEKTKTTGPAPRRRYLAHFHVQKRRYDNLKNWKAFCYSGKE